MLTVGSLFSGIGGLDLGLERAGMRVVWQAEVDPYCCRVLEKHWPGVPNLGDVTKVDWSGVERVDVICGGYPCQPFSYAGNRLGEGDSRHLWPFVADAIRVLRPRFAVLENVPGHLALGFGRVLGDLAEIGYDAEWDCVPAAAVGAHHLRDRVFVVAYPDEHRRDADGGHEAGAEGQARCSVGALGEQRTHSPRPVVGIETASGRTEGLADADGVRRIGRPRVFRPAGRRQPPHSSEWAAEPDVGRVAHGVPARVDRLRGLGNAVVPQVAEHVGRLLLAHIGREAA